MVREGNMPMRQGWATRLFTAHPASVGETYGSHLRFAFRFGSCMVAGGIACMVHGVLPFCLTTSGSRRVRLLHDVLSRHPVRRHAAAAPAFNPAAGLAFDWTI